MDFSKIQNPRVREYLQSKYAKQQELDQAKENEQFYGGLADAAASLGTAAVNSSPKVQYYNRMQDLGKVPTMGQGYQGNIDASPVRQMLKSRVSGAQEGLARIGQDFDEQNKLEAYSRAEADYAGESDPNSEISRQYQGLAKKFMPNGNYEGVSAAKLKQLMPPLEKAYQYDMQKVMRAEDLAERRKDRATQFAIAQGARADAKAQKEGEYQASVKVPDMEIEPGFRPSAKDADIVRKSKAAYDGINKQLKALDTLYKESGTNLVGDDATTQEAIVTDIQLQLKELQNLGVLNGPDLELLMKQVPNPASFSENLKGMLGWDQYPAKSEQFKTSLTNRMESTGKAYGYKPSSTNDKPSWAK